MHHKTNVKSAKIVPTQQFKSAKVTLCANKSATFQSGRSFEASMHNDSRSATIVSLLFNK